MKKFLAIAIVAIFALAAANSYACDGKTSSAKASKAKAEVSGVKSSCAAKDVKVTAAVAKDALCPVTGVKVITADSKTGCGTNAKVMTADSKADCSSKAKGMSAGSASECPYANKAKLEKTSASGCCAHKSDAMMQKASVKTAGDQEGSTSCHTAPASQETKSNKADVSPESVENNSGSMAATGNAAP